MLRAKFRGAHYKRSEIGDTTENAESAKLHTRRDLVPRALLALMPHVPGALCALVRHEPCSLRTFFASRSSSVNRYDMQSILMVSYHNGLMWFISYISLQDTVIYVNLTILTHQPKFIRTPTLRRACQMELRYFYFHNFNTLYPLKNKE